MSLEPISILKAIAVAAALAFGLAAAPALAAGGGGSGGGATPAVECTSNHYYSETKKICVAMPSCPQGQVFDTKKEACEPKQAINEEDLYRVGHDLALAGQYQDALDVLGSIRDKNDAMVLTMIGYSTRKLGNTEEGIAIYHQALAIDPDNVNTHEYLGEGYLASGRVDLAEAELDTLARLCGTTCEQYQDLQKAILEGPVWN